MRQLLIVLFLVFAGCAAMDEAQKAAIECHKDAECHEKSAAQAAFVKDMVSLWNGAVGGAAGAATYGLAHMINGLRLRKKKKEQE